MGHRIGGYLTCVCISKSIKNEIRPTADSNPQLQLTGFPPTEMGGNHIGAHPLSTETPTGMPASARVRMARKRMAGPEARGSIAAASSRSRVVIEMSTWATPKNHNHSLASGPNFGIHLCCSPAAGNRQNPQRMEQEGTNARLALPPSRERLGSRRFGRAWWVWFKREWWSSAVAPRPFLARPAAGRNGG
jgi:hypothetical protein